MKRALMPLLALLAVGCTSLPTPHGRARFWGDYKTVYLKDGDFIFAATDMKHSPAVRAHWRGAGMLAGQAASAVVALHNPAMGAGAVIVGPALAPRK